MTNKLSSFIADGSRWLVYPFAQSEIVFGQM